VKIPATDEKTADYILAQTLVSVIFSHQMSGRKQVTEYNDCLSSNWCHRN